MPGYTGTVTLASNDTGAMLPAAYQFTSADAGKHTFSVTFSAASTATGFTPSITATDNGATPLTASVSTNLTATQAAAVTHFGITIGENVQAGSETPVTVTALNANNQPVTGYTGTVTFTSSDSAATLPGSYAFTSGKGFRQDDGSHTFMVNFATAGVQTVTVTDASNNTITASTNVYAASVATQLLVIAPVDAPVGVAVPVTVLALDASGHVVSNYDGTVALTASPSSGVTITGPITAKPVSLGLFHFTGAGAETFMVTFTTAGSETLTATDAGDSLTGTAIVTAVARSSTGGGSGLGGGGGCDGGGASGRQGIAHIVDEVLQAFNFSRGRH